MSALAYIACLTLAIRWIAPSPAIVVAAAPIGVACYAVVVLALSI